MPIYEYECSVCGHRLEVIQQVNDTPLMECPDCNTSSLRKLVSAAGFRLKGTGWYVTDFKNKSNPKADKPNNFKNADSDTSNNTTSDTKKSGTTGDFKSSAVPQS